MSQLIAMQRLLVAELLVQSREVLDLLLQLGLASHLQEADVVEVTHTIHRAAHHLGVVQP